LAEENYGWLFVDTVPLLYEKKKVARQLQIETWLDLYQLTKELNIQKPENQSVANAPMNYVI
jgi:maltose-binding protein MalE